MTPSEKQHWRYTFAGQLIEATHSQHEGYASCAREAVAFADALLSALETSAPKELRMENLRDEIAARMQALADLDKEASEPKACEHEWSFLNEKALCVKCGVYR